MPENTRDRACNTMNELKKFLILSVLVSFFTSILVSGFIIGISNVTFIDNLAVLPGSVIEKVTPTVPEVGQAQEVPTGEYNPQTTQEQAIIDTVKKSRESVVSVVATRDVPALRRGTTPFGFPDDFFQEFFEGFQVPRSRGQELERKQVSAGTGFLISGDGMIITNKHVVSDTKADYTVFLNNGTEINARVLARDPVQDIAIMKIDRSGLPFLPLGDSNTIEIGQTAIAIGNALGEFENTVSVGVVSGLSRTITAQGGGQSEVLEDIIQTDAAINPGNSGGPLLNLRGEVIGINTAMAQGAQSIGFAIPINKAKRDVDQIRIQGKISYPFLGVRYQLITPTIAKENDLPVEYGAWLVRGEGSNQRAVTSGSPAARAGLKQGDIILEFDGKRITPNESLAHFIAEKNVGDIVSLRIRSGSEERIVPVTLIERPE